MKKAKDAFKEMVSLCYDEDCPELHKELISLESDVKVEKSKIKYEIAMNEIFNIIPLFADDFSPETMNQLEEIYNNYFES